MQERYGKQYRSLALSIERENKMKKYNITYQEVLEYNFTVEAESEAEAIKKFDNMVMEGEIIFDDSEIVESAVTHIKEEPQQRIKVLVVEPKLKSYVAEIGADLKFMQDVVGGYIQAIYPWEDPVALVCNEESKINGMTPNRALYDENGNIYDIVCGTFFICGLGEDSFTSLDERYIEKYEKLFDGR